MSTRQWVIKCVALAGFVAIPFLLGANCAPVGLPAGADGDPAGAPLPDLNVDPSSGAPLPRLPQKGDVASLSATKSFAVTGIRLGQRNTIPMKVTLLPPEVDSSFLNVRIAKVQDDHGGTLWQLVQAADVAPAEYGQLGPLGANLEINYTAPDLVFETLKATIVVSAPLAGEPAIAGLVPEGEFVLGSLVITLLPPDAPLTVVASAFPQAITVDGNGGPLATTTTLRAEILGGVFIPAQIYEVFWTVQGLPLTAAGSFEPVFTEDLDGDGVDDLIVSEKSVTANEFAALAGTGLLVLNVTARDAMGTEINDVTYVTVNDSLTVTATMTPEVFVGDGELRTLLNANVTGGAGGYRFQWASVPEIPGLFDEVDTTAQYISFRARDVQDVQVSFTVTVTDVAGNTAVATARRGGGEDPDPPAEIPDQLVVSIENPPTCAVINGTVALDGKATGGVEPLGFHWTAACGEFAAADAEDTAWTAPANAQACAMTFTATDKNGLSKSQTIAVKIAQPKVAFTAGSSVVPEAPGGGHPIGVVLSLPAGCSLQESVTVELVDLGTGTATPGADYSALSVPTTVTFPAGSVNGEVQYANLEVLDDNVDEDDETVVLGLDHPTGGAGLASPTSHIVTITDDDRAVVSIAGVSLAEGNVGQTDFVFVVSLSNPSAYDVTVSYNTLDGTATAAGDDYIPQDGVVTFPALDNTDRQIVVKVNGDVYHEDDETFRVKLTNAAHAAIAPDGSTGVGTIVNDDGMSLLNVLSPTNIPEGDTGTGLAIFTVTLTPASPKPVTVNYETLDGTATLADDDYGAESGVLTFAPGEVSKQVLVRIYGDVKVESDEAFSLRIFDPVQAAIGDAQQNIQILNDDSAVISIEDLVAIEGTGGMTNFEFKVTLSKPSATPISVDYTTAPDVAGLASATPVDDYDPAGGSIVVPPDTTQTTIVIPVVADIFDEPNETFLVNITTPSPEASIGKGQAVGTILDDDGPPTLSVFAPGQLGFGLGAYSEGVGNAVFNVVLLPASNQMVTVVVTTQDGTATVADGDYVSETTTLEFLPGETLKTFDVEIIDDGLDEGLLLQPETLFVLLHSPVNATIQSGYERDTAYIVDNDGKPTVTLTTLIDVEEGDFGQRLAVVRVDLSAPSEIDFEIAYTTQNGTAAAGSDYVATSGSIQFTRRSLTTYIYVPVAGDVLLEGNETFSVVLEAAGLADIWRYSGIGVAARTAVVNIVDDDAPDISINDVRVDEGAGAAILTVSITKAIAPGHPPLTVSYETVAGTATGGNVDYNDVVGGTVSFPADGTTKSATISVDITDDALACEGDEQFQVNLSSPSAGTIVRGQGMVTIVDNDARPTLQVANATPQPEGTPLEFEVTLMGECTQEVTVTVSTAHGTAGPTDYAGVSQVLTFAANGGPTQTQTVTVNTLADSIDEADETVLVNLTNAINAVVTAAQAEGTILDANNPPRLSINNIIIEEGDNGQTQAVFTVRLNAASGLPVSVQVDTADGDGVSGPENTATTPDDYVAVSALMLTFPPGETTRTVIVQIRGDRLSEDQEIFSVNLSNPVNAVIQNGTGLGRIARSDRPEVSIDLDVARAEGNGAGTRDFTFRVRLSNPIATNQSDLVVNVVVNDQTALAGSDYSVPASQVTFPADGSTVVQDFIVQINRDNINEPNETFEVRLSGIASGEGSIVPGDGRSRIGTIVNDDGAPQLVISGAVADENAGTITLNVDLVGPATENTVTVNWATADGTADAPADYAAASGLLTFTPGTVTQPVVIALADDGIYEGTEQFFVTLSSAVNATIATPQAAAVITDDEAVPSVSIVPQAGLTIVEGDAGQPALLFNIVLSHPSAFEVSAEYSTADGTAVADDDYVTVTGAAVFAPGVTSVPVAVYVLPDTTDEDDETFTIDLVSATGATIGTGSQIITIQDDDPEPSLSITDVTDDEGSGGGTRDFVFTVTLSQASEKTVTVTVNTAPATDLGPLQSQATAGADYTAVVGLVLTFLPGETSKPVPVAVVQDNSNEGLNVLGRAERFDVVLSGEVNATINKGIGQGAIIDDDGL